MNLKTPALPGVTAIAPRRRRRYPPLNALIGGGLLAALVLLALLGVVWTPYDPLKLDLLSRLHAPDAAHWLGTDEFGRDVFSRLIIGARTSLWISLLSVSVAVVCGTGMDEAVKNDIAIAERLRITATTLDGILTVKAQGRKQ